MGLWSQVVTGGEGRLMRLLALMAILASAQAGQIMAGPAFELFARHGDLACPSRKLRTITPGDLSWEQETFEAQLSPKSRKLLARVNQASTRCAGRDGLSCPTSATLDAMARAKMLAAFGDFACQHPQP